MRSSKAAIVFALVVVTIILTTRFTLAQGNTSHTPTADEDVPHTVAITIPSTGDPAADLAALMALAATLISLAKATHVEPTDETVSENVEGAFTIEALNESAERDETPVRKG